MHSQTSQNVTSNLSKEPVAPLTEEQVKSGSGSVQGAGQELDAQNDADQVEESAFLSAGLAQNLLPQLCHEVRSPLLGMQGLIQKLTEDYAQDLYLVEHLRLLGVSLEQVLSVTENTLTFSQLQNASLPIHEDALFLPDWLEDTLQLLQPLAAEKNLSLNWQVSLEDEQKWVLGDGVRLSQIVNNLVVNALKFTKYGGVSVKLNAYCVKELRETLQSEFSQSVSRVYCLRVEDSGIGMSQSQLSQIFGAYQQAAEGRPTSGNNPFGVGLGLSIVEALVKQMSGIVTVESLENEGTTFEVYLPLKVCLPQDVLETDTPADSQNAQPEMKRVVKTQAAAHLKRVLVVDDSAINRKVLENQLLAFGCDVFHARNGEEAVACVQKQPVDVIFMDIQMPIMDGVTAAKQIRAWQKSAPSSSLQAIYAVTAGGEAVDLMDSESRAQGQALFTLWLSKPLARAQLMDLLQVHQEEAGSEQNSLPPSASSTETFEDTEESLGLLPDYLKPLYAEFKAKMQQQKSALHQAVRQQEAESAKRIVHGMKGDAMVFQQQACVKKCQMIEQQLNEQPIRWQEIAYWLGK